MAKDITECSEGCGAAVLDKAKHRRWHRNVVTVRDESRRREPLPFIGRPDDVADAHLDDDDTSQHAT